MTVRIGTNPIAWSNDDLPELGGATPLATCLAEARQAGFAGIELGNKFPREAAALKTVLGRHGLALVSGWYGSELLRRSIDEEWLAMQPHLDLLVALGCRVCVFCEVTDTVHPRREVPLSRRPTIDGDGLRRLARALDDVAGRMKGRGLTMAYHYHMGTVVQTADEVDALMVATRPDVGLLLDTGHCAFAGGDPAALARRHAARVVHVHAKDVRPQRVAAAARADRSFLDAVIDGVFTVPGDGAIDFAACLAPFAGVRYHGWLVVEAEQDPAKAPALEYATKGYKALVTAAKAAGLVLTTAVRPEEPA